MPNISVSTNFPQGFANGVSVRGMPLLQSQPGQVYFVGNSPVVGPNAKAGSDGNRGTFLDPFATLNNAVNSVCGLYQNRGDIIFVMAGHKETISSATALALNTAGVAIIGLGSGNARPTFTLGTAATTTIAVNAANVSIQNCVFLGNFLSIASTFTAQGASFTASFAPNPTNYPTTTITTSGIMTVTGTPTGTIMPGSCVIQTTTNGIPAGTVVLLQLSGTTGGAGQYIVSTSFTQASGTVNTGPQDFAIDNCEFRDLSTTLGFLSYFTDTSTANACNRFQFTRNVINSLSTVSPTVALSFQSNQDGMIIADNTGTSALTATTQGPMLMAAGSANMTNIQIARNKMKRPNTSSTVPCAISASGTGWTGMAWDNYFGAIPSGTGIWISTGTGLSFINNYSQITGAADKSALINPSAV